MKKILFLFGLVGASTFASAQTFKTVSDTSASLSVSGREVHNRYYVSGVVTSGRPGTKAPGGHVDVQLLDSAHKVIATGTDKVGGSTRHPMTPGYGRATYTVSFPAKLASQASTVRVVLHDHAHETCGTPCS